MSEAYAPAIVETADGLAAVSLAAYDVEVTRLRRQRNAFVVLAAVLAVALLAAIA